MSQLSFRHGALHGVLILLALTTAVFSCGRIFYEPSTAKPSPTPITDSSKFLISYGHSVKTLNDITNFAREAKTRGNTLQAALEACRELPKWTNQSWDAISFAKEYRPKIAAPNYLRSLDEIEERARLNLTSFDALRPHCNDPNIQMLDLLASD